MSYSNNIASDLDSMRYERNKSFGGEIRLSDFDKSYMSSVADRIASDSLFDRTCKKNAEYVNRATDMNY